MSLNPDARIICRSITVTAPGASWTGWLSREAESTTEISFKNSCSDRTGSAPWA